MEVEWTVHAERIGPRRRCIICIAGYNILSMLSPASCPLKHRDVAPTPSPYEDKEEIGSRPGLTQLSQTVALFPPLVLFSSFKV